MKKVLVIGCPGSGKSTFARRLRDDVDAAAEHGYGISVNIERRTMRNTVDSERHTRHNDRTGRGKVT